MTYSLKKDYQNPQTGSARTETLIKEVPAQMLLQNEIHGKNLDQQYILLDEFRRGMLQLNKIFEVRQNELTSYPDDLATSFACVEMEIAKCISGCLPYSEQENQDIDLCLSLVRDYRVVVPVRGQNPTVSLHRFHLILQDNFPDSYLTKLFNIFLLGFEAVQPKVITFF